jgi:polysaccharide deacetylase family protein (PEP-CTERM system associated)
MTIDVEDWFHVENLKPAIRRDSWHGREVPVERNTERMLELLDEHHTRATCFVLGWVAERCPSLVQRIAAAGHEVACHGYGHDLVYELSEETFREDVRRCKELLEDLTGARVRGYRAPNFSITDWRSRLSKSSDSPTTHRCSRPSPMSDTASWPVCQRVARWSNWHRAFTRSASRVSSWVP